MRTIYVDNNATTPVAPEVVEAMAPYLSESYFNPNAMYETAQKVAAAITDSRKRIAHIFHADDPTEILFVSCATESTNTAIFGAVKANAERRHIITTAVEHPAVLEVCKQLERDGYDVTFLPVDEDGNLDLAEFVRVLRPQETLLVSIMHANNETGVIFPIEELSRLTKETDPDILFHTDATQTVGKLPIDMSGTLQHVDMLSFSGHKIYAPKGIGALYTRRGTRCRPLLIGGHQEGGRRAGTENVPYIVGLARALELLEQNHDEDEANARHLRDLLEEGLKKNIPYVKVNGEAAPRLSNTLNISCHYIEGEGMLYQLSEHGICASSGSACTSASLEPSYVLGAMSIPFTAAHGSIRFSFGRYNTEEDVQQVIQVFPPIVASLRKMSPYWDNEKNQPREDAPSE